MTDWESTLRETQAFDEFASDSVATVFFQGLGASRAQAAHYVGPEGVEIPDGRWRRASVWNAPRLLYNLHPYPELPEVGYGIDANPLHWPMLGATIGMNWWRGVRGAPAHYVRIGRVEMAGRENVATHLAATRACVEANPKKKIVLFGTSRGAATTFISLCQMEQELRDRIAFAVLEGVPDSVHGVLQARAYLPDLVESAFYRRSGHGLFVPSPLDCAGDYPTELPTLFVTSKVDTRVPPECTARLMDMIRMRGARYEHLELKRAGHSSCATHNPEDQLAYHATLRKMYRKFI